MLNIILVVSLVVQQSGNACSNCEQGLTGVSCSQEQQGLLKHACEEICAAEKRCQEKQEGCEHIQQMESNQATLLRECRQQEEAEKKKKTGSAPKVPKADEKARPAPPKTKTAMT